MLPVDKVTETKRSRHANESPPSEKMTEAIAMDSNNSILDPTEMPLLDKSIEPEEEFKMRDLSDVYLNLKSAYDISRNEIAKAKKEGRFKEVEGLGYGEVDVQAFGHFIRCLPPIHEKGTFLDLGSGSGKAVLAAAFSGMFSQCIGVEIMEPLHNLAIQALERATQLDERQASIATFELGDIFEKEALVAKADAILVTCTLFTDDMMERLNSVLNRFAKSGTIVVTTTRRLSTPRAKLLSEGRVKYAKGSLLFIVYLIA